MTCIIIELRKRSIGSIKLIGSNLEMVSETNMFVPLGGAISLLFFIFFTLNPLSSEVSSVLRFAPTQQVRNFTQTLKQKL